jgi:hypothetical protein
MADDPEEGIYRAMVEDDDGMPKLGPAATKLGIRRGKDIVPDTSHLVHRPAFRYDEPNGLTCVPTIQELPYFALPVEWGGTNRKTSVWKIEASALGPALVAGEDTEPGATDRHISVGPSRTMLYDDYVTAIEATRARWQKITKA